MIQTLAFSHTHSPSHLSAAFARALSSDQTLTDTTRFPAAPPRDEAWSDAPVRAGSLSRRPDWRTRLDNTFDAWSMRRYESGKVCCFTFVCACIDAMCGTDLEAAHFGGWRGAGNVWQYLGLIGGRDFFDRIGPRIDDLEALPGDLIQMETRHGNRLHLHWAIATGEPHRGVVFDIGGVTLIDTYQDTAPHEGQIKAWSVG